MPNDIYEPDEYLDGRTSVSVASGIEFFFAKPHSFDVSLTITDESGKEVTGLNNVSLYYSGGLDTNLTWSPQQRRYVGSLAETDVTPVAEFLVLRNGVYKFDKVMVGNEEIKIASYAPVISAYSRASMKLTGVYLAEENYVVALSDAQSGGFATQQISLEFEEASTANVYGLFEKTGVGATESYVIPAVRGSSEVSQNSYIFTVPRVNGYWELKEIKMSGINYDADPNDDVSGTFYTGTALDELFAETDENGSALTMVKVDQATWNDAADYLDLGEIYPKWNVPSDSLVQDGVWTKVKVVASVTTQNLVYPDYPNPGAYVTLSNKFMEEVDSPAMKVTLLDFQHEPIQGVNSVVVTLAYDHNTADYKSSDPNPDKTYTVTLSDNGDGTYTAAEGSQKIWLDGQYKVVFSYKVGNVDAEQVKNGIVGIEVQTTLPTVVISGVDPTSLETHESDHRTGDQNTFSDYEATVYFKCTKSSGCNPTHTYSKSKVKIKLTNYGNADGATLSFGSDAHVYPESSNTKTGFTWNGDGECTREIGYLTSNTAKTAAGEIRAEELHLTYKEVTYKIDVPDITIYNPY